MPDIQVTNTLTRRKEQFSPQVPGKVSMYVCGVTTYDQSHLGHARPAVVFDVIRRYLRLKGLDVYMVQNFTDVDDKIIARANERGMDPLDLSRHYCQEYLQNMEQLGVAPADVYPKVSEHIPDIISMVAGLIEKGAAYQAGSDVYFAVESFPEYGKLSNQNLAELETGTRIAVDENKKNPLDFVLWKGAKPGEPSWESPWGIGRPGWHIECSTLARKYLGDTIDIHGGGVDLVFPHHENEVAQSEAFTGRAPFARYWLHNGLVNVSGEKMSKSLGNFISVADALAQYPAGLVRFYILSHQYRTPVDFDPAKLVAAGKAWDKLNRTVWELEASVTEQDWPGLPAVWEGAPAPQGELPQAIWQAALRCDAALADDFNTAAVVGILFETVAAVRAMQGGAPTKGAQAGGTAIGLGVALGFLRAVAGDLLGVLAPPSQKQRDSGLTEQLIQLAVELRTAARVRRDWAAADEIRQRLSSMGITLEDTPEGTHWSF